MNCKTTKNYIKLTRPFQASFGLTLIELMTVVAIVGVIAMIAVPSYEKYRRDVNNQIAVGYLQTIRGSIERYFVETNRFPAGLADLGNLPNNGEDPWGNQFVYLNIANAGPGVMGQVRKDRKLNPINTEYDLYSMGEDGVTKKQISNKDSLDDVILARDGQFIGLARDF
ncbi:prepilin-type N-terminal cleavage/methylation domain-containing protein [Methylophaga sp. OBS1]|uniref:prepilin-type N-terminal cleavage/methylation domain-containing protein n=1 Tax=Methylophaga sp. OBS1 TaxID=2991933 RepID=UPI00224F1E69|nr:prepilin-type N-terminal cleavage/methylation domain-containing protein [Methylophaga sp. OBS1]MCX4191376.1 prepilin-type N-terminal cleavage/methylation domain-containing protein [Methylophaga sp. OBS1]MCX4191678.1 prepilin-type N-terminal cleavage/methylation domain-containing protein [Methylophaga sp. OBS1]